MLLRAFASAGMCLPSRCLVMDIHVTIRVLHIPKLLFISKHVVFSRQCLKLCMKKQNFIMTLLIIPENHCCRASLYSPFEARVLTFTLPIQTE
jgi:hypothetical protein